MLIEMNDILTAFVDGYKDGVADGVYRLPTEAKAGMILAYDLGWNAGAQDAVEGTDGVNDALLLLHSKGARRWSLWAEDHYHPDSPHKQAFILTARALASLIVLLEAHREDRNAFAAQ